MAGKEFAVPDIPVSIFIGVDAPTGGPDRDYYLHGDIKIEPKLGVSNYLSWGEEMQLLLEAKNIWRIISNNIPQPDQETGRTNYHKEWKRDSTQRRM